MRRFKFEISVEDTPESNGTIFKRRLREELIFQALLSEKEVDIDAVRRKIVGGGGERNDSRD